MGTIRYYNENAKVFAENTFCADMSAVRDVFARSVSKGGRILDLGCGSGRDSAAFLKAGFETDSVDGSENICREAERLTGQRVICSTFEAFEAEEKYDGIWACASLLHVEREKLPELVKKYSEMLKKGGIFYMSFKYGTFEGERGGRYFTDMDESGVDKILPEGLAKKCVTCTTDVRPGRENERWINIFLEKL